MTLMRRMFAVVAALGLITTSVGAVYPVAASTAGYGGLTGTDPLDAAAGTSGTSGTTGAFPDGSRALGDAASATSDVSTTSATSDTSVPETAEPPPGGPRDRTSADPLSAAAEPSGAGGGNHGGEMELNTVRRADTFQSLEQDAYCSSGAREVTYNVSAIDVDIPLNRFGDHDPKGRMYVLDSRIDEVRAQERSMNVTPGLHNDPIQPLVVRANLGDCVQIRFTNRLGDEPASVHVHRGKIPPGESGSHVGYNDDSTVAPGESTTYTFQIEEDPQLEGIWYFHSHGNRKQVSHGLFGALAVEPKGSEWLDPHTGEPKKSGWSAVIEMPDGAEAPDFREHVILYHNVGPDTFNPVDESGNKLPTVDPKTDAYRPATKAMNYRSEAHMRRMELLSSDEYPDRMPPTDFDESLAYSSYTFGDPATPMPTSYVGDPTKIRIANAGSSTQHSHHLHGGGIRWRFQPDASEDPDYWHKGLTKQQDHPQGKSQRLDSQLIGPGETYTHEIACGAGGCQGAPGDFLFHCHVADHYIAGMWTFWRVYDTKEAYLKELPDRVGETPEPVNSTELIGMTLPSGTTLTADNIDEWIESQLPPQGVPEGYDATVWNWSVENTSQGPLYYGEPYDTVEWPNYDTANPGERPVIKFNPENGRIAYPLLTPHLGRRPPFAPNHGPAPYLGRQESPNEMAQNTDRTRVREDTNRPRDQLCPENSTIKRYNIVAIQKEMNIDDDSDEAMGELFVLAENKDAVLNEKRPPKPLVYRANVGDCVEITLTSELRDEFSINHNFAKVNIHPHFIQFDPQASDGVITGLNYETSVRPYRTENRQLTDDVSAGDRTIHVSTTDGLREGITVGVGLGEDSIEVHRIERIDESANTVTFEEPVVRRHAKDEAVGVEFVRYRYYVDANFGAVFFHDHVLAHQSFPRGLFGALITEPSNSTYHDPQTGEPIRQGPIADVHTNVSNRVSRAAGGDGESFREAVMLLAERRDEDIDGVEGWINTRAAPFDQRDPRAVLSSVLNGDPPTPVVQAYEGDPTVFRVVSGGPDTTFPFRVTGHRYRPEHFENATPRQTTLASPSERFALMLDGGAGQRGDYLYYVPQADKFRGGMWGIFRVFDNQSSTLQPLPDRPEPPESDTFIGDETGKLPLEPGTPGTPCPDGAPVREFNVTALATDVVTNKEKGKFERSMSVFALSRHVGEIRSDERRAQPLVLRAAAGDCVEVHLTNELVERVSLNIGKVKADPRRSSGVTVGYNYDQAVEPGKTQTYRVYVDEQVGAGVITDFALAGHLSGTDVSESGDTYGLYGTLVTAPEGAEFYDPATGERVKTGWDVVVSTPEETYRDYALLFQAQDPTIGTHVMPYKEDVDGVAAINYRIEPFEERLGENEDVSKVYDSDTHGDPETPLPQAYAGDPTRVHVVHGFGFQTGVFTLDGHRWPYDRNIPNATLLAAWSYGPHQVLDISLDGGAGRPGDYLYQNHELPFTEAGQWGIFRVHDPDRRQADARPLSSEDASDWREDSPQRSSASSDSTRSSTVTWTPSDDEDDGAGYVVYRTDDPGERYAPVSGVVTNTTFVDTSVLPGTTYHYRVTAVESDGDRSALSPASSATTLPLLRLNETTETLLSSPIGSTETLTIQARAEAGIDRVELVADDGTVVAEATRVGLLRQPPFIDPFVGLYEVTLDTTTLSDGEHSLAVRTVDADGRTTEVTRTVSVDNTAPDVDAVLDGAVLDRVQPAVSGTAPLAVNATDAISDVQSVAFRVDGGTWTELADTDGDGVWEGGVDTTPLADGNHTLELRATDDLDNVRTTSHTITVDNTVPAINEVTLDGTPLSQLTTALSGTVTLAVDASDGLSGVEAVEYRFDGGSWQPLADADGDGVWETAIDTTQLSDGAHDLTVRVTDAAGNEKLRTDEVTVENSLLAFDTTIDGTPIGQLEAVSGKPALEVHPADASSVDAVSYRVDDGNWTAITDADGDDVWETPLDTTGFGDGGHVLDIEVADGAGDTNVKSYSVTFDNTIPAFDAAVDGTPLEIVDAPLTDTVTLAVNATDATSGVETVEYRTDGGTWTELADTDGDGVWDVTIDTTTLSDGAHDLTVRVTDAAGNANSRTTAVDVDNTPPAADVSIDGTPIGQLTGALSDTVTLAVNATDAVSGVDVVEYRIDGGTWTELTDGDGDGVWDTTIDTTALADGDHTLEVRSTDAVGNVRTTSHTVTVDNTPLSFAAAIDGTPIDQLGAVSGQPTLEVTPDDAGSVDTVSYRVDDGNWTAITDADGDGVWETALDTTGFGDGGHALDVEVTDGTGDVNTKSYSVTFDNTAPAFDAAIDGTPLDLVDTALTDTVTLSVNATDATSGVDVVEYRVDAGSWRTVTDADGDGVREAAIDTTALSDGAHDLTVRVTDAAGNANSRTTAVDVDNTAPAADVSLDGTPLSQVTVLSGTVPLAVSATDATSGVDAVEFRIDGGTWTQIADNDGDGVWETTIDTTTLGDGSHTVEVRTTDRAGNVNLQGGSVDVDNTAPSFDTYIDGTLVSLLDTVLSGDVTLEVDAQDGVSGVDTVQYQIDSNGWNGITDADGDGVWETTIDTTQYGDGDHTLRIRVADAAGNVRTKSFGITIDNLLL